jgi:luciferase family oxidoreductase group 1
MRVTGGEGLELSVLDLAPVPAGSTPSEALRNSVDLAAHVEGQGYRRYWVAEHHNRPGIASSSPAVLLAHVAAATSSIRLGSGGVMLANHAPLAVAEQFGMLEALNPGRIDLGVGRAVGSDDATARALRSDDQTVERFSTLVTELLAFFTGRSSGADPSAHVVAIPGRGLLPQVWVLGASTASAQVAARLGLPFSFAHHFNPDATLEAVRVYWRSFKPSPFSSTPRVMVALAVICAEDDERAQWLAGPVGLAFVRAARGGSGPLPSPDEAASHRYQPGERAMATARLQAQAVGGPDRVRRRLHELATATCARELMLVTMVHGHGDRIESYRLVADALGLPPRERAVREHHPGQ